jgi:hypothetical protein
MFPPTVSRAGLVPSISPCAENWSTLGGPKDESKFGKRRESRGFNVLSEAQVIAALISMQDHSAMPLLFHVGSGVVAASLRNWIRKTEIMQTLQGH